MIALAVRMVRETRMHSDIKLGASIRAAIDMIDLFAGMQKLADHPDRNFLAAARMALSNKIWLNEMTSNTADEIIEDIWNRLKSQFDKFSDSFSNAGATNEREIPEKTEEPEQQSKKKLMN
jgi:MoxR-like ATPase